VSEAAPALLELRNVDVFYGRVQALRDVSLTVGEGEIVALIGSNGAGKTTTLRLISGLNRPAKGDVRLRREPIQTLGAEKIARMGIGHAPEGRRLFPRMTVRENLDMGAYARRDRAGIRDDFERVFTLFPRLRERQTQLAGSLSGGEQQMVAIGRALMGSPTLLLLDEPSLGLSPILVDAIFEVIREINAKGTTILLIEQNALLALKTASRGYVLETGSLATSGTSEELLDSPDVQRAYLGM
jgi:branched-chain amino acid transport system ATP-binding protein